MGEIKPIVIFCIWKRIYRIDDILQQLNNQTYKNFDVLIWNNDINNMEILNTHKGKYNFQINIIHSTINVGGIGRFYAAKYCIDTHKQFIFFDDDQIIEKDFIQNMVNEYEPKTIKSTYSWKFKSEKYFDRYSVSDNNPAHYCGTGGMIGDMNIFKIDMIYQPPIGFEFVEDLWLSYVADISGYKLKGIYKPLNSIDDGNDQWMDLVKTKNNLLKELIYNYNWKCIE